MTVPVTKAKSAPMVMAAQQFRDAFSGGMASLTKACQIYVAAIDASPEQAEDFRESLADIIRDNAVWARLEMVGRGYLYDRLLYAGGGTYRALVALPLSTQKLAVDSGVEVLVAGGDTLRLKAHEMTKLQRDQVFAKDHVRSLAEQRAWYSDNGPATNAAPEERTQPWEIKRGKLSVLHPVTLTRREVAQILAEMER